MNNAFIENAITVVVFAATALIIGGIVYAVNFQKCDSKADVMHVEYKYGLLIGCMVKYDGKWLPIEAIRTF